MAVFCLQSLLSKLYFNRPDILKNISCRITNESLRHSFDSAFPLYYMGKSLWEDITFVQELPAT